jgi:hypothetical protein
LSFIDYQNTDPVPVTFSREQLAARVSDQIYAPLETFIVDDRQLLFDLFAELEHVNKELSGLQTGLGNYQRANTIA